MLSCNLFMMTCNYWSCMSMYQSGIWRRIMSQGFPVGSFQVALSWKVPGLAHEASASKGSRLRVVPMTWQEPKPSSIRPLWVKWFQNLRCVNKGGGLSWSLCKCCIASFPEFTIPEGVGGWRILFRLSHP